MTTNMRKRLLLFIGLMALLCDLAQSNKVSIVHRQKRQFGCGGCGGGGCCGTSCCQPPPIIPLLPPVLPPCCLPPPPPPPPPPCCLPPPPPPPCCLPPPPPPPCCLPPPPPPPCCLPPPIPVCPSLCRPMCSPYCIRRVLLLRRNKRDTSDLIRNDRIGSEEVENVKKREVNYNYLMGATNYQQQQPMLNNFNYQQQTGIQQSNCVQCQRNGGRVKRQNPNFNAQYLQPGGNPYQQPNIVNQPSNCVQCRNGGRVGRTKAKRQANYNYMGNFQPQAQYWNQGPQQQSSCIPCNANRQQQFAFTSDDARFNSFMNNGNINQQPFKNAVSKT
uniref:Uncharacterized protein n=1 Tax=Plectus sambesii TaxID=2011161 RepID=A0A914W8Q6_9BILA